MDLDIKRIRTAQPEEWDVIWRNCSYATYFHSREWAEIWSHYSHGWMRPNPLLVRFTDGQQALLPLSCEMSGDSVKGFWSSPEGTYGGWIAVDPIRKEHAILMKEFLTTELGALWWQTNPFDDLVAASAVNCNIEDETHVIDLGKGFDAVYSDWSSACRRAERKARKSGVVVKVADTEAEWREYYQAYEDSFRRWGDQAKGSLHGWALFQEMFDCRSDHIKLWLAMTKEGDVAAGALMCYAKMHVVYWHGASMEAYFALRPVNLLFYEIIRQASAGPYRWFDFNSSAGLEGVRRFKESFGTTPLDCSIVHISSQKHSD
jgi:hypothetical protein